MDSRWQMYQDKKILDLAREESRRHMQDDDIEAERRREDEYERNLDIYREERGR